MLLFIITTFTFMFISTKELNKIEVEIQQERLMKQLRKERLQYEKAHRTRIKK